MAEKNQKPISSFITDIKDLSKDELWDVILYTCSVANNEEKWEVEVVAKYHWISGTAKGHDVGKFYQFLISKGLNEKIEIVRG